MKKTVTTVLSIIGALAAAAALLFLFRDKLAALKEKYCCCCKFGDGKDGDLPSTTNEEVGAAEAADAAAIEEEFKDYADVPPVPEEAEE